MSMETAPQLIDNSMNFDPTVESTTSPHQSHDKPLSQVDAMIAKVTHPPTTVPEFEGLPTQDTRTQVVINWRNIDVLKTPIVADRSSGNYVASNWQTQYDYGLIIPDGARIKYIGCCYDVSKQYYEQDAANVGVQDVFDFSTWRSTVNKYRPVAHSTTVYANVTGFNNQGISSTEQFNPNILFAGSMSQFSFDNIKGFCGVLDHLFEKRGNNLFITEETHPDINPVALDIWIKTRKVNLGKFKGLGIDPDNFLQIINIANVGYDSDLTSYMPTPSQIATNSMRSSQDKFVNGVFAVNRINTLSPAWLTGSNTGMTDQAKGLYDCWIFTVDNTGVEHYVQLIDPTPAGTPFADANKMVDTLWSTDMTWTFIRFQGIVPNLFGATTDQTASPLAIKKYYSFEAQPVWNGPWNGLSRVSPKPSLKAMQALMDVFYEMPDAMAAKYNGLGEFLPFLIEAIPSAIKGIKSIFSKKKPTDDAAKDMQTSNKVLAAKPRNNTNSDNDKITKMLREMQKQINEIKMREPMPKRRKSRASTTNKRRVIK